MSRGARILLGIAALACAAGFAAIGAMAGAIMPAGPLPFYGLAAFCGLIGLACVSTGSHPVALRLIGLTVFAAYAAYVAVMFREFFAAPVPNALPAPPRPSSLAKAIGGFFAFGMPAAYLMIHGRYPRWGKAAAVFGAKKTAGPTR